MHAPFRIGKWLYATNGHYCIRVPATEEPEATGALPKNVGDLFDKAFTNAEFLLMPDFKQAPICTKCGGSGRNKYQKPDDIIDDECLECFGRGFQKWMRTPVGDAVFELGYLNKMQALPQAHSELADTKNRWRLFSMAGRHC